MPKTKIEWTEHSWNFLTGCDKVSPGCQHCYAEIMSRRLKAMGQEKYVNGFELNIHPESFELPLKWKKPRLIFVNSMSDFFHPKVPLDVIQKTLSIMEKAHWHQFQVLTKRSKRLVSLDSQIVWPSNVWMGVSIENSHFIQRLDDLKNCSARVKFLSLEPLLGPLPDLKLDGIDWVIAGGESGTRSREIKGEWVSEIRDQCVDQGVPFFFKHWGGRNKKKAGNILDGEVWVQMPELVYS